MKKNIAAVLVLLLTLSFSLFAGEYTVKTEHFDFIFSDETEETAYEVIDVAEEYYSKLVSFFSYDPEMHIPVYFKYDIKSYNAYYTAYPADHIVMFVTSIPTSLFMNVDYPLSLTFYHELTHAFTHNIKSGFTKFLSNVFGDPVSPADLLYMNKAFTEGIAVYVESSQGEGRLNDESSLYLVNQMSSETEDLYYLDIEGSRDRTPGGNMSYILGASFLNYLGKTYGEDKVASFIVAVYKFPISTPELIFKKNFGVRMKDAWSDFVLSCTIAEDLKEPETITGWGSWYNLALKDGDLYVENISTSGVFRLSDDGETKRIKLTASSFEDLSFSSSYYLLPYVTTKSRSVSVVDMSGKEVKSFDDYYTGLLLSDEMILLLTEEDRNMRLDLREIKSGNLLSSFDLGRDITLSSGVALSDDEALFLFSQGGRTYVLSLSVSSGKMEKIEFDKSIFIHSLSLSSDSTLSFSYITQEKGTFMKYGELRKKNGVWTYVLSDDEYNGGIYYPVKKDDTLYFVSRFFSGKKVSKLDYSSLTFGEEKKAAASPLTIRTSDETKERGEKGTYNPILYMNRGLLLPTASGSGKIIGEKTGLGLSYKVMDPTERHTVVASFGYSLDEKMPLVYMSYQYKDYFAASLFSSYKDGHTNVEIDLTGSYTKTLSSDSRYIKLSDTVAVARNSGSSMFKNYLTLTYQDAYSFGFSRHELLGWSGSVGLVNLTPEASIGLYIPRILPFESTERMAYNIPVKTGFSISDFKSPTLGANADFYLFTYEVQSSIRFLYLYIRNIDVIFSYKGKLVTENMAYSDIYTMKVWLGLSPVVGTFAQVPFGVELGVKYERNKAKFSFLFDFAN